MRLPNNYILNSNPTVQKIELETYLRDIAQAINGNIREWTPALYGEGTAGTVTYTVQEGWYMRQNQMIDVWFAVAWSAWAGGAGNINMDLPLKTWNSGTTFWTGSIMSSNVSFANALDTYCAPVADYDSYVCKFASGRHAGVKGLIQVQAAGNFTGHIRYLGQFDG